MNISLYKFAMGIFIVLMVTQRIIAQSKTSSLTFEGAYTADSYSVLLGGIENKIGYLGMANMRAAFDTKQAKLWDGGVAFINAVALHGTSLSEAAGDFQVASNIDAGGDFMYIQECWYKQTLGNVDITVGLQDLNAEFIVSNGGGNFVNSSFGVPSVISDNIPLPIFPLTTLGVSLKWNVSDKILWQSALFDGMASDFSQNNTYNLNWEINKNDGLLGISELTLIGTAFKKNFTCKLGGYYHSTLIQFDETSLTNEIIFDNNKGLYALLDQNLWNNLDSSRSFDYFVQLATSPKTDNTHNLYVGCGITFKGICKKRDNDVFGIALANAFFNNSDVSHETAIELNYNLMVNDNISIQPDVQYIINPAGTGKKLSDALVGLLRIGVSF